MNFYSIRDLRTNTKNMWNSLANGEEIIITNNGKPAAVMLDVSDDNFEETLQAIRQAKAMIAFNNMRSRAAKQGFLSDEEIETEIKKARKRE
ncbi:MAG: type II toxin-antitoxin system prevent-host-death family antitoxin [Clostridiales bacterium]|nr:type II toxin-antitoxin system prevent-host-death family antitoxin [Clostridiales bacterium]